MSASSSASPSPGRRQVSPRGARLRIQHALGEDAREHHRAPPQHGRRAPCGCRERREAPKHLLRRPVVGAHGRRSPPSLRVATPCRIVHHPRERRSEARSKSAGHHFDLLECVGGVLQRGTLGRSFELVLELQPVDHVGLLSDAPPSEMAVADPGASSMAWRPRRSAARATPGPGSARGLRLPRAPPGGRAPPRPGSRRAPAPPAPARRECGRAGPDARARPRPSWWCSRAGKPSPLGPRTAPPPG